MRTAKQKSQDKNAPKEFAFVCWCARSAPTSDVVDQIYRRAHETLDWKRVQWLAERNGIAPLVHRTLSAVCPTAVPTLIRSELQRTYDAVASDGLVYTRELVRLVGVLSDAGVTAVPYKGPELAASAHGSFFYRRFADLDVVVDASDFPTARNVLIGLECKPQRDLAEGQDASMHSAIDYCETFDCPSSIGTIPLEVHWRIPATFGFDVRSCWPRLRTERLLDRDILQLSPEDVVVLLTVHGFKHFWQRLKWIADLAEFIGSHPHLNWQWLIDEGIRLGGLRVVLVGCQLAHDLLGAPVPPEVVARAASDRQVAGIVRAVQKRMMQDGYNPRAGVRANILIRERASDQMRYVMNVARYLTVPSSAARASLTLPPSLDFLHYVLYPFRLAGQRLKKRRSYHRT